MSMRKNIISTDIKLMFRLVKIGFLEQYVYKLATFFNFLTTLLYITVQYFLWRAIYSSTALVSINQYTFNNVLVYICLSQVISLVFPSNISGKFSDYVRTGDIIHTLLKPVNIETQLFYESIGRSMYRLFTNALPTFIIMLILIPQVSQIRILTLFQFIVIFLFSYVFMFYFEMLMGVMSFYTVSIWGIQSFKYVVIAILSGRIMPISLYPEVFKRIVNLLPFKIVYFTPLEFVMGKSNSSFSYIVGYQIVSIIVLYFSYKLIYANALKRLIVQGG